MYRMELVKRKFTFYPFPDNLRKRMTMGRYHISGKAMVTFVRHNLCNYDLLRKNYELDPEETREFKAFVNELIYKTLYLYNQLYYMRTGNMIFSERTIAVNNIYELVLKKRNQKWINTVNYQYKEEVT